MPSEGKCPLSTGPRVRASGLRNQLKLRAESHNPQAAAEAGPSLCCVKALKLGAEYKTALEEKKETPDVRRPQKSGFPVVMYTGPYFESLLCWRGGGEEEGK